MTDVTFVDSEAICPSCGMTARVLDGTFSGAAGSVVQILAAPEYTHQRPASLRRAALSAQSLARTDPDAAIREIVKVDEGLAAVLRRFLTSEMWTSGGPLLAAFMAALAIVAALYMTSGSVT